MNMNPNTIMNFMNFRNNFRGNPQAMVQQLLNSGQITQEQYNNAVQLAQQLQNTIIPFARR